MEAKKHRPCIKFKLNALIERVPPLRIVCGKVEIVAGKQVRLQPGNPLRT